MATPELWIVRHGETEWSRVRKHTGRTDLPLTEAGERAAVAIAERLDGVHFDLVLASPLKRAWRTAELAGLSPSPEPRIQEWDYGEYEGRRTVDIREERPDWLVWEDSVPGGETIEQVAERADQVIARVCAEASERALVVAHGHVLRILALRWIGADPKLGRHLRLETAKISVLGWDRGVPLIERWNT